MIDPKRSDTESRTAFRSRVTSGGGGKNGPISDLPLTADVTTLERWSVQGAIADADSRSLAVNPHSLTRKQENHARRVGRRVASSRLPQDTAAVIVPAGL
jgi:hypothetical protein